MVQPGPSHWSILRLLIQGAGTRCQSHHGCPSGRLAIEHKAMLCSAASDYRRFAGLRVINPLA